MSPERPRAVILAAGHGRRLGCEDEPKPMAGLDGKPLIQHTLELATSIDLPCPVLVVGFKANKIIQFVGDGVTYAHQAVLDGTAGALETGLAKMDSCITDVLVLQGDDSARFKGQTILELLEQHRRSEAWATMLITNKWDPETHTAQYQIEDDEVVARISGRKVDPSQGGFSTGVYCFKRDFLERYLPKVKPDPSGERGIPRLFELAIADNKLVVAKVLLDPSESVSINTPEQLAAAQNTAARE